MNVTEATYMNADRTAVTAVIDGKRIDNITAASRFWAAVQAVRISDYVAPSLPAVDDIPLTLEERIALIEGETQIPPDKVRALKQSKRDRGEA